MRLLRLSLLPFSPLFCHQPHKNMREKKKRKKEKEAGLLVQEEEKKRSGEGGGNTHRDGVGCFEREGVWELKQHWF